MCIWGGGVTQEHPAVTALTPMEVDAFRAAKQVCLVGGPVCMCNPAVFAGVGVCACQSCRVSCRVSVVCILSRVCAYLSCRVFLSIKSTEPPCMDRHNGADSALYELKYIWTVQGVAEGNLCILLCVAFCAACSVAFL